MLGIPTRDMLTYTNMAYLIALFITFLLTATLWRVTTSAQNESEINLQKYKAQAAVEIAKSQAIADVAKADASKAVESYGKVQVQLEQEKLKTAELQANFAWRTLSVKQVDVIKSMLVGPKGKIHCLWISGDPESFYYAKQIATLFGSEGWSITGHAIVVSSASSFGVQVPDRDGLDVSLVRSAFRAANVRFGIDKPPPPGMWFGTPEQADEIVIFVGSKMPPNLTP